MGPVPEEALLHEEQLGFSWTAPTRAPLYESRQDVSPFSIARPDAIA